MRNIPMFTTDDGVASLVLEEIPYKKEAYIRIQSATAPKRLMNDCIAFCRSAGAEHIYAAGHECLSEYPLHTAMWRMSCMRSKLRQTNAKLLLVRKDTLDQWCKIYNKRMTGVPNSATMTLRIAKELLESVSGYFVYRDNTLLGIGKAAGDMIHAVVSLVPGAGEDILLALCHSLTAETLHVEVASANLRAVQLYQRVGFEVTEKLSEWYCVK